MRDDASRAACDAYVSAHPQRSAYHLPRVARRDRVARSATTPAISSPSRRGAIVGVLPLVFFSSRLFGRFAVSVPFVNYGGVLADDRDGGTRAVDRAIEETRSAGGSHLELRHTRQHVPRPRRQAPQGGDDARRSQTRRNANGSASTGRCATRCARRRRAGSTDEHGGVELLDAFYAVFAHNMRDLGTPVYGDAVLREVLTAFPDSGARLRRQPPGRPVAASIVHWHRDAIEVPWASSLREFNPLCANVLLYWQMLQFAVGTRRPDVRFRPLDAGRRHLPLQAAVGRRAARAGLGILDARTVPRFPT